MVNALDSGLSSPSSNPSQSTALCSWARHFTLTVPFFAHAGVYLGTFAFIAESNPAIDQHPIKGGVEVLLIASCHRDRDKLRPDGPLGSYADFTFIPSFPVFYFLFSVPDVLKKNLACSAHFLHVRLCRKVFSVSRLHLKPNELIKRDRLQARETCSLHLQKSFKNNLIIFFLSYNRILSYFIF